MGILWKMQRGPPIFRDLQMIVWVHDESLSHVQLFVTPWTVAHQAPLSMGFSRREYWSRLPCPSPGHLPDPGIEPTSLTTPTLAGGFFATSITWEALEMIRSHPRPLGKAASEEEGKMKKEVSWTPKREKEKEEDNNGAKLK